MEIELGVGLIRLADPNRGGDLLDRVQRVRQNIAGEIGILMPKVRIRDNMRLDANQYRIKIADIPVAQGELEPTQLLAIDSGMTTGKVDGIATKDPAFGSDAKWINPGLADQAELYGLHGRRAGRGAGDASHGSLPPSCGRNSHARRDEASGRRAEDDVADGGERADSGRDVAGGGAGDFAPACCASRFRSGS